MEKKILLATIQYLAKKQNRDEEDLKNEKRAWNRLVELGEKQEEDIPARLADVEVLSAAEEAAIIQAEEKAAKEEAERKAKEDAEKAAKEEAERKAKEEAEKGKLEGDQGDGQSEGDNTPKTETSTPAKKATTKKATTQKAANPK